MADETEPSFEEALAEIERIVASLEHGEPALSTALARYETGVKLLRHCYQILDQAEQSVALLTGVDEQGNPVTAPFDATATLSSPPVASDPEPTLRGPDRVSSRPNARAARPESSDPPF
jgi:exodeoxyribonuclease VII small subunit